MKLLRALVGGIKEVNQKSYTKQFQGVSHVVLDVRNAQAYESEHIEGSINIPFNKLAKKLKSLPQNQPIVCVCHDGLRGREAAYMLQSAGYEVANLTGGMLGWRKDGGKVVR